MRLPTQSSKTCVVCGATLHLQKRERAEVRGIKPNGEKFVIGGKKVQETWRCENGHLHLETHPDKGELRLG